MDIYWVNHTEHTKYAGKVQSIFLSDLIVRILTTTVQAVNFPCSICRQNCVCEVYRIKSIPVMSIQICRSQFANFTCQLSLVLTFIYCRYIPILDINNQSFRYNIQQYKFYALEINQQRKFQIVQRHCKLISFFGVFHAMYRPNLPEVWQMLHNLTRPMLSCFIPGKQYEPLGRGQ